MESLERRQLLAAVVAQPPAPEGSIRTVLEGAIGFLPEQVQQQLAPAITFLEDFNASMSFLAFPGETNDVQLGSQAGNVILQLNENTENALLRLAVPGAALPFSKDLVESAFHINVATEGAGAGAFGPVVAEVGASLGGVFTFEDLPTAFLRNLFDFPESRALVVNPTALLEMVPALGDVVNVFNDVLDFDVTSLIDPITQNGVQFPGLPSEDFKFGPFTIDAGSIIPEFELIPPVNVTGLFQDAGVPTSIRDVFDFLPSQIRDIVDQVTEFVGLFDAERNRFISDSVFVSTLDGNDRIDASLLTGIEQRLFAGAGDDIVIPGGTENIFDYLESQGLPLGFLSPGDGGDHARVEVDAGDGDDAIVIDRRFNRFDFHVDGGAGNDRLVIPGDDRDDIIELVAGPDGKLEFIHFYVPDPNAGVAANELQEISLPPQTTGGAFRLSYLHRGGTGVATSYSTDPIPFESGGMVVSAADVEDALRSIPVLDGNVQVSGPIGGPWGVEFVGALAESRQAPLTIDSGDLVTSQGTVRTFEVVEGSSESGQNSIQRVMFPVAADGSRYVSGGEFTLSFDGETTDPIRYNASAVEIENALATLTAIGEGDVRVNGRFGGPWFVEFTGELALQDQPLLVAAGEGGLTGGVSASVDSDQAADPATQVITLPVATSGLGGTFELRFDDGQVVDSTGPLPADLSSFDLEDALGRLASVGFGNVAVSGPAGGPWTVDLSGVPAASGNRIVGVADDLRGGVVASVTEVDGFGRNEVQTVSVAGASGGDFRLTFRNGVIARTTPPLFHDATAAEIEQALGALGSIGGGDNVSVSGPAGGPWEIEFTGDLAASGQLLLETDGGNLTPADPAVPVEIDVLRTTTHQPGQNETQTIEFAPAPSGGHFRLRFDGESTQPIPFDATASVVRAALESLVGIEPGDIEVVAATNGYGLTFTGNLAFSDVDPVEVDATDLAGGFTSTDIEVTDSAAANETQTVTLTPTPQAGTFTLRFLGATTDPIPFDATAGEIRDALEAVSAIGPGNIVVTGTPAGTIAIEFVGKFSGSDVPSVSVDTAALSLANLIDVSRDTDAAARNERQGVALPRGTQSGDFTLSFRSMVVTETQAGTDTTGEVQTVSLPGGTTGGTFRLGFGGNRTEPLPFDATAGEVQSALRGLPSIGGPDVEVSDGPGAGTWTVTFVGGRATGDQVQIRAEAGGLMGDFETAPIPFDASPDDVRGALESLASIGAGNVLVTSNHSTGGPWELEFVGELAGTPLEVVSGDGANLVVAGGEGGSVRVLISGGNGAPVLVTTTKFSTLQNVESLRIEGGGGDDRLIIRGAPEFPLGIFFDGGTGTDSVEFISAEAAPRFVAPVFPSDTQATVTMDGQPIQFVDVEGELVFDADGRAGSVVFTGTDAANDLRFAGTGPGAATLSNDGQVALRLTRFGSESEVRLFGAQGDDTLSVAPNGVSEFSRLVIEGGGPAGANRVRFEGTPGNDVWTYRPDATDPEAGVVTYDFGSTSLEAEFQGAGEVLFVGLEGEDRFTAIEPFVGSDDTVIYTQEAGNNGRFRFVSAQGTTSSPVHLHNIEERTFDTGEGVDRFSLFRGSTFPDLDLNVTIGGGDGVSEITIEGFTTTFVHDTSESDRITLENDTHADTIDVIPGVGVDIDLSTILGVSLLRYHARPTPATIDVRGRRITQSEVGEVTYTMADEVRWMGGGTPESLTFEPGSFVGPLAYRPLSPTSGLFHFGGEETVYRFDGLAGELRLGGGSAPDDRLIVEGTEVDDRIRVSASARTVEVATRTPLVDLKGITLADGVERVTVDARGGSDLVWVSPDYGAGSLLVVDVIGGDGAESNRLVVEDEGAGDVVRHHVGISPDRGEVIVGDLPRVGYRSVQRVDILPLDDDPDSETFGGTGADGLGRIVAFHPDPFSPNESWRNPTDWEDLLEHIHRPHISPGGVTDPFGTGSDVPGDEDWYRYTPTATSTIRFGLEFDPIETLPNGRPGLPGDGELRIDLFSADGTPISRLPSDDDAAEQTVGVEEGVAVLIRVRGETPDAINLYRIAATNLDDIGPVVFDPDGDGPALGVHISGHPNFNLFDVKPREQGPTPPVRGLTIHLRDAPIRFPGFLYEAIDEEISGHEGHFRLVGDESGIIAISEVIITNAPVVAGEFATATIELRFDEPLPDDRFTLTLTDSIRDPGGNRLDGESDASEPNGNPNLPSGDTIAGGDFVARFTVDSRPEIGTVSQGLVYVDANGNFRFDPSGPDSDATNRDFVYQFGAISDAHFAGNFADARTGVASGFDKLGVYGSFDGVYSFMLDTDDDGVGDFASVMPPQYQVNGSPVAGNFAPDVDGDQIGLFDGQAWYLDLNGNGRIDVGERIPATYNGLPVVGDFNGDGTDDLAVYDNATNTFTFDYNWDGVGDALWAVRDDLQRFPGISGFTDRPVAGDINLDGIDDLGLWTKGRQGILPREAGEFFFWVSDGVGPDPSDVFHAFSPSPIGNDLFAQFGDETALPVFGNFDPPVTSDVEGSPRRFLQNEDNPYDVNRDGRVTSLDALLIINELSRRGGAWTVPSSQAVRFAATLGGRGYDVTGDDRVTPLDALRVINRLSFGVGAIAGEGESGEGERESAVASRYVAAVDRLHASPDRNDTDWDDDRLRLIELDDLARSRFDP